MHIIFFVDVRYISSLITPVSLISVIQCIDHPGQCYSKMTRCS